MNLLTGQSGILIDERFFAPSVRCRSIMKSTVSRVPAITGLPAATFGSIVITFCQIMGALGVIIAHLSCGVAELSPPDALCRLALKGGG